MTHSIETLLTKPCVQALFSVLAPLPTRLVGGCVRDALIGVDNPDIDVAVAAPPPDIVKTLIDQGIKVMPTGIKFGTITAIIDHHPFQITSLRCDLDSKGRHPQVKFSTDWLQDAKRRDFTLNAIYLDNQGNVYDPFDGVEDLMKGKVRFIGDAKQRLQEDYLRILRYYRFLAWFGREPYETVPALRTLRLKLKSLSLERIQGELLKLLAAKDPRPAVSFMKNDGILEALWDHSLAITYFEKLVAFEEACSIPGLALRRLGALCYPLANTIPGFFHTYFRLSSVQSRFLKNIIDTAKQEDRRWILYHHGPAFYQDWCLLRAALTNESVILEADLKWAKNQPPLILPITGQDIIAQGLPPGPSIGKLLKECEKWWMDHDFQPDRQACLEYCLSIKKAP